MDSRWTLKPSPDPSKIQSLQEDLGVNKLIASILVQKGIDTFQKAKRFFRPSLEDLYDPFLMKDMAKAVHRIEKAIEQKEKILVYGDYDVDGTTSVAMMYSFLSTIHHQRSFYIPDRYDEGYGISYKGIDFASREGFSLIICLDCGIKAIEKVSYAKDKGIDFIICDHHRPGTSVPNAVAILDPKQTDCEYPYKELSGCGVGFKLIQAYAQKNEISFDSLMPYLDLLAISIAADIVPITDENRVLAFYGLKQLNKNPRVGVKALIDVSNRKNELTISDLVFGIAPRINAAGRIHHAKKAVELLVENDQKKANEIAKSINEYNINRKTLDEAITKEALTMVKKNHKSTVVFHKKWHKGVIGIVASRLIEHHYRPTIVFTESNGMLTGSARSVSGFDIYNAIESCSDFIVQFGGHKYAAGLSIKKEQLSAFSKKFEEIVSTTILDEQCAPEILIDAKIEVNEIDKKLVRILNQMEPFGPQNNRPVFCSNNIIDNGYGRLIGSDKSHIKLGITDHNKSNVIDAIGFRMAHKYHIIERGDSFDVCYVVEENEWNGAVNLQLRIKDIKANEE